MAARPYLRGPYLASKTNNRNPLLRRDVDHLASGATLSITAVATLRRREQRHPLASGTLRLRSRSQLRTPLLGYPGPHSIQGLLVVGKRKVERLAQRLVRDIWGISSARPITRRSSKLTIVSRANTSSGDDKVIVLGHTPGRFDAIRVSMRFTLCASTSLTSPPRHRQ